MIGHIQRACKAGEVRGRDQRIMRTREDTQQRIAVVEKFEDEAVDNGKVSDHIVET